jgi:hypothetical protein
MTRTIGNLGEDMLFSGDTTVAGPREDELEIPLVNVSRRSEYLRIIK